MSFQTRVGVILATVRAAVRDGISWFGPGDDGQAGLGEIVQAVLLGLMNAATETMLDASGPEKKQAVLDGVGQVFDLIAPHIPLPWFLQPLRSVIVSRLRKFVLWLANGAIESVYQEFKERFRG